MGRSNLISENDPHFHRKTVLSKLVEIYKVARLLMCEYIETKQDTIDSIIIPDVTDKIERTGHIGAVPTHNYTL